MHNVFHAIGQTYRVRLLLFGVLSIAGSLLLLLNAQSAFAQCPSGPPWTFPGNEAPNSLIPLQMPFIAGESWTVGGGGSFYGNAAHCNVNDDHYATDWNRANDDGAVVLPVAAGTVSAVAVPDTANRCPWSGGYGCYVQIDHANGYRSLYAHLAQVLVIGGTSVQTWNLIGKVGSTGNSNAPHLHLTFRRNDGGYHSRCWNNGARCLTANGTQSPIESMMPQGHKPSPMMTAAGPVTLQDGGTYTSVNGRVQLPDLRTVGGWTTDLYLRNDGTEWRQLNVYYYNSSGTYTGANYCGLWPNTMCYLWSVSTNGTAYVDGGEAASVVAVRYRGSPIVYALHLGVSRPDSQVLLPLVHRYNYGTSSKVMIKNASTTADWATIRFQTSSGEICPQSYYLTGNASVAVDLRNVTCLAAGVYGARITSSGGQPLAVVTTQEGDANSDGLPEQVSDFEGFANASYSIVSNSSLYPLLMRDNYGASAGISLQNPNAASNQIQINYYNQAPGGYCCTAWHTPSAYSVTPIYPLSAVPSGFVGSGIGTSNSGLPFISIVNQIQTGGNQSMSYAATSVATPKAAVPVLFKLYGSWDTGISIQNGGGSADTARVDYYDFYGNYFGYVDYSIPVGSAKAIYPLPLSNGTIGSAAIRTLGGQPISVVVNHINVNAGSSDAWMTSTGTNR